MNWLQSVGLSICCMVIGGAVIASADLTEPTQVAYLAVLSIGALCLMLGGVKQDVKE